MKKGNAKSIFLLLLLLLIPAVGSAESDLVAHWALDERSGTKVADTSAEGHNGELLGGLSFEENSVAGERCRALHLDGSDDGIFIPKQFYMPTDAFTISLWFKPDFTLSRKDRQMYIVSTDGKVECERPLLIFNKQGVGEMCFYIQVGGLNYDVVSKKRSWSAGIWHHIAVTFDSKDFKLYVDGSLEKVLSFPRRHRGSHCAANRFFFGISPTGQYGFDGKLDDIRFYSGALSKDDIFQFCPPMYPELAGSYHKAGLILEERGPEKAIGFLERKISESEARMDSEANGFRPRCQEALMDLRYKLASAKEAGGFPKNDVAAAYKAVIKSGIFPTPNWGSSLLWLYDNTSGEAYEDTIQTLIQNDGRFLRRVAAKAERMAEEGKPEAIKFLEDHLAVYLRWQKKDRGVDSPAGGSLPDVYILLGKIKEMLGQGKKEVAESYRKAFSSSGGSFSDEHATALIWLLENECNQEYPAIIQSFTQSGDAGDSAREIIREACSYFESEKDWITFERLLDSLFLKAEYPSDWAVFVESCLCDKADRWFKAYLDYLTNRFRLKLGFDWEAEKCMAGEEYEKAAQIYETILNGRASADKKRRLEFRLCKCLFLGGEYRKAVARLESFVDNNKAFNETQAKEAMLMKGRAFIQLGELDKAVDIYKAFATENPESEKVPEANCYVGYCRMLQGKFERAEETFREVIEHYPQSSFANKARLCLSPHFSQTD